MKLRPVIKFNQTCRASLTRIENEHSSPAWWAIPRLPKLRITALPAGPVVLLSLRTRPVPATKKRSLAQAGNSPFPRVDTERGDYKSGWKTAGPPVLSSIGPRYSANRLKSQRLVCAPPAKNKVFETLANSNKFPRRKRRSILSGLFSQGYAASSGEFNPERLKIKLQLDLPLLTDNFPSGCAFFKIL